MGELIGHLEDLELLMLNTRGYLWEQAWPDTSIGLKAREVEVWLSKIIN